MASLSTLRTNSFSFMFGSLDVECPCRQRPAFAAARLLEPTRRARSCRTLAERRQSCPRRTTFLRFVADGLSRISLPCRSDYVSTLRGDECRSATSLPCPRRTTFLRFATTTLGARARLVEGCRYGSQYLA